MSARFDDLIFNSPKCYLHDYEVAAFLQGSESQRHSLIKRELKKESIIQLRKGLYLIKKTFWKPLPDLFEISAHIYGPSYVSFESALSYHGWIPEAVYATTGACARRSTTFQTPLGTFSFKRVPLQGFYLGVQRVVKQDSICLIADPWKALADYVYCFRKEWPNLRSLTSDLRIEEDTLKRSDMELLRELASEYPSKRVRKFLEIMWQELVLCQLECSKTV